MTNGSASRFSDGVPEYPETTRWLTGRTNRLAAFVVVAAGASLLLNPPSAAILATMAIAMTMTINTGEKEMLAGFQQRVLESKTYHICRDTTTSIFVRSLRSGLQHRLPGYPYPCYQPPPRPSSQC